MKTRAPQPRFVLLALATALACSIAACAWDPWIPGQSRWNPEIVVDPATLPQPLALDAPYVDDLNCYARRCQKRFRVIVDQPGQLTVSAVLELASQDEQARIVLEAVRGVIGHDGTGRGVRTDVAPISVRRTVEPGTYYVLLQSVGGPIPYELTATLTPGAGPEGTPRAEPEAPVAARRPDDATHRFSKVDLGAKTGAGYDPEVVFSDLRTFTFPRPSRPGDPAAAGTPLETPGDRQIRRLLAESLELKGFRQGFRQATGDEQAHLVVTFSTAQRSSALPAIPGLYQSYNFTSLDLGREVDTRGQLVVDIVDVRSGRLAWHAWTTKGIGPGITYGERTSALLREAIAELLAAFPPH
jgi:hypothetical protein